MAHPYILLISKNLQKYQKQLPFRKKKRNSRIEGYFNVSASSNDFLGTK